MPTQQLLQTKQYLAVLTRLATLSVFGTKDDILTLIPDTVLPEQFFAQSEGTARTRGHVALRLAILTDAIECYRLQFLPSGPRDQHLAIEAKAWLFSNDERWPFAFVNVCAALGIEPDYVRRELRRARRNSPVTAKRKLRHAAPVRRIPRLAA